MLTSKQAQEVEMRLAQMGRDADMLKDVFDRHALNHTSHAMGACCDLLGHVQKKFQVEQDEANDKKRRAGEGRARRGNEQ